MCSPFAEQSRSRDQFCLAYRVTRQAPGRAALHVQSAAQLSAFRSAPLRRTSSVSPPFLSLHDRRPDPSSERLSLDPSNSNTQWAFPVGRPFRPLGEGASRGGQTEVSGPVGAWRIGAGIANRITLSALVQARDTHDPLVGDSVQISHCSA